MCSKRETSLLTNCSLVLDGLKVASLIMCSKEEIKYFYEVAYFNLLKKGIKIKILGKCKNCYRMYIYDEKNLKNKLNKEKEKQFLSYYGYKNMNLDEMLRKLKFNLENSTNDFPHEIGIFLGYPIDDVLAFVENQGKNYKLCGCWKVYSNISRAKKCFKEYEVCKNKYLQRVYNNENFIDIIGA